MSDNAISSTTQEFLDVYDIANDLVILKDGTVSMILQIGTMNFSLLAEQEQDAIMYTYGALLNSLNFPIQINIQSSTKDATRYLRLLDVQAEKSSSPEKAQRIKRYRDFVANLIHERNVLEKKFFVCVPTGAAEMGLYTAQNILPGKTKFDINSVEKAVLIEKASTVLDPRRDHLIAQFNRIGLFARQIDTQEIIQNFYINYNPESTEGQEVTNSDSYATPMVRASFGDQKVVPPINMAPKESLDSPVQTDPIRELESEIELRPEIETEPAPIQAEPTALQTEPVSIQSPAPTPIQIPELKPTAAPTPIPMSRSADQANVPAFSEEISSLQINEPVVTQEQSMPANALNNARVNRPAQDGLPVPPIAEL